MDRMAREAHLRQITEQGFTIVENAIEPDFADALLTDIYRLEKELRLIPAGNDFEGRSTLRIHNLLAHGPLYQTIPVDPGILPIVDLVLGPGCLVSMLGSINIGPVRRLSRSMPMIRSSPWSSLIARWSAIRCGL